MQFAFISIAALLKLDRDHNDVDQGHKVAREN